MPTHHQVVTLLQAGSDFREVGDRLGIPPGQVYMIATGLPADGSDVPPKRAAARERRQ